MDLTAEKLARLRELANAATPGPRRLTNKHGWSGVERHDGEDLLIYAQCDSNIHGWHGRVVADNHIDLELAAACDPETILALLNKIDSQSNIIQDWSNKIREWQEATGFSHPSACADELEQARATIQEMKPAYILDHIRRGNVGSPTPYPHCPNCGEPPDTCVCTEIGRMSE